MSSDPAHLRPELLRPSSQEMIRSPEATVVAVVSEHILHTNPDVLSPPIDPAVIVEPANVYRPKEGKIPRRMSISDKELLDRALASLNERQPSLSRPSSAEQQHRARTRSHIPISQTIREQERLDHAEVFCLAYTPDNAQLVAGCGDGSLRVFNAHTNKLVTVLHHVEDQERLPTTCIKFNPSGKNERDHLLLVATADGMISHWNIGENSCKCLRSFKEQNSSVYAVDYQADGRQYATGGRDHVVRIYDEEKDVLIRACDNMGSHGHSNRIFSVKYHPTEPHLIVSGGWDNTIQFWDDRTGFSVRSIYGPHICGDALDMSANGEEILTGSWREEDALQRWDFKTGKLKDTIAWNGPTVEHVHPTKPEPTCMLYACAYSPDETMIAAGGAGNGVNQAKLFDAKTGLPTDRVTLSHGLYSLAFSPNGQRLVLGGVDPSLTVINFS